MSSRSKTSTKQATKPKSERSSISAEDMARLEAAKQKALLGLLVLRMRRYDPLDDELPFFALVGDITREDGDARRTTGELSNPVRRPTADGSPRPYATPC